MEKVNLLEMDELTVFEKAVIAKLASIDESLSKITIRSQKITNRIDKLVSLVKDLPNAINRTCVLDTETLSESVAPDIDGKLNKPLTVDAKEVDRDKLIQSIIEKAKELGLDDNTITLTIDGNMLELTNWLKELRKSMNEA